MVKRSGLLLVFLLAGAPQAGAFNLFGLDLQGIEIDLGLSLIGNVVPDSGPDPVVTPLGISFPLRFPGNWTFRPGVMINFSNYGFQDHRAVPLEAMFDSVTMMSLFIHLPVGYIWEMGPNLRIVAEGGPVITPRVPIALNGQTAKDFVGDVTGYYFAGRQFYFMLDGGVLWQFSELLALHSHAYYYLPLYNFWTAQPFWDQQIIGLSFGFRFTF